MFDKPTPAGETGDMINQKEHLNDLLVIQVHEHIPHMQTKFTKPGEVTPAVKATVYVIAPDATISAEYVNTLLFGKVLTDQLKRSEGRTVVGILAEGEQRGSNNAPYLLNEAPPQAEEAAVRAMTNKPAPAQQAPAQPAQQAPAQPAAPWAQQPAAAVPAAPWAQ